MQYLNGIEICLASTKDCAEICELAALAWQKTYISIISQSQIDDMLAYFYSPPALQNLIEKESLFVARQQDGILLGFCCLIQNKNTLQIERIYIAPNRQGTGVGRLLMAFGEQQAHKKGISKIFLYVNRKNTAIEFYKKCGFTIEKELDRYFGIYPLNDYIMSKYIQE